MCHFGAQCQDSGLTAKVTILDGLEWNKAVIFHPTRLKTCCFPPDCESYELSRWRSLHGEKPWLKLLTYLSRILSGKRGQSGTRSFQAKPNRSYSVCMERLPSIME